MLRGLSCEQLRWWKKDKSMRAKSIQHEGMECLLDGERGRGMGGTATAGPGGSAGTSATFPSLIPTLTTSLNTSFFITELVRKFCIARLS